MKYIAAVLAVALFASLALVPNTRAAPAPVKPQEESATCGGMLIAIFPLGGGNTWIIGVTGATGPIDGPWLMYHGTTTCGCTYKGCPFVPTPTFQWGPFVGDLDTTVVATHAEMAGWWQAVSATQTSNAIHVN